MIALKIEDKKRFTSELFVGELFDRFLLREADIVTFNAFSVDGLIRHGYYTEAELEEGRVEAYSFWSAVKPFCFSLIKGKKLPESFLIVLQQPPSAVERFLAANSLPMKAEQIKGLYLNIRYEDGELICVTGTSVDFFTLDKSLDRAWDEAVVDYFRGRQISFVVS